MNKEKEKKLYLAIAKLTEFHVGDRVIVTSRMAGQSNTCCDADCSECLNKTGTITAIQGDDIKTYSIKMDDFTLPQYGYAIGTFKKII